MKDFNAQQAKKIVDSLHINEIYDILREIKTNAEQGQSVLHIYKSLKDKTVNALLDKGFKVINQSHIAVQKDDLHYSIYWE